MDKLRVNGRLLIVVEEVLKDNAMIKIMFWKIILGN
jgi:hypothetical protein